MQNETAKTCARLGAAALIISMFFPWFGQDFGPVAVNYDVLHDSRGAAIALGVFALAALTQIEFGGPGLMGRVWGLVGGGVAAYLAFRIFAPPKDPVSDMLEAMQLKLHARPGVYVALAGSVMIAYGGWIETKFQLSRSASRDLPMVDERGMLVGQARPQVAPGAGQAVATPVSPGVQRPVSPTPTPAGGVPEAGIPIAFARATQTQVQAPQAAQGPVPARPAPAQFAPTQHAPTLPAQPAPAQPAPAPPAPAQSAPAQSAQPAPVLPAQPAPVLPAQPAPAPPTRPAQPTRPARPTPTLPAPSAPAPPAHGHPMPPAQSASPAPAPASPPVQGSHTLAP
ncbi:MAG: hypothetical protein HY827_09165 [Actinobacteria bacterium]|nr:hypothetical protein [Actinomycetota bacterium]